MFQRMMCNLLGTQQQLAGNRVPRREGGAPAARSELGRLLQPVLRSSIAVLALVALPALSAGINGTGITFCSNDNYNDVGCNQVAADGQTHPRQNGRYGRDAQASVPGQLKKIGDGQVGFDYTKISNGGGELLASAGLGSGPNDWACTRDNVTGLIWEVKTASGLRSQSNTYTWYSSDSNSNGGAPGTASRGSCSIQGDCDTEKFVADVNAAPLPLCGPGVWRMPTVKELEGLSDFGLALPAIDPSYFPNTPPNAQFWSGTAGSAYLAAWMVDAYDGSTTAQQRGNAKSVRLVRDGS